MKEATTTHLCCLFFIWSLFVTICIAFFFMHFWRRNKGFVVVVFALTATEKENKQRFVSRGRMGIAKTKTKGRGRFSPPRFFLLASFPSRIPASTQRVLTRNRKQQKKRLKFSARVKTGTDFSSEV